MIIGKFTSVEDGGYVGLILAPGGLINPVRIAPVAGKGVDYVITVDGRHGFDLGVAWNRHSTKTGKAYLSVKLDSASAQHPAMTCANLFSSISKEPLVLEHPMLTGAGVRMKKLNREGSKPKVEESIRGLFKRFLSRLASQCLGISVRSEARLTGIRFLYI